MNQELLSQAATMARGLAIDAVHACSSGHLGLPLGAAELGAVLFGHSLQYCPDQPRWLNRDRFILSAGHGSMFLYAWLHLAGFDLSLEQIQNFRQLHSASPGHPEFGETPGVEATTGPLGQGVGNAVGYAIAGQMLAARCNTPQHTGVRLPRDRTGGRRLSAGRSGQRGRGVGRTPGAGQPDPDLRRQ